jgi:uncharacterized protein YjbI with pentapeptide repeats
MSTIVTRAGKGSPLTNTEVDSNFTNLNTDKAELSGSAFTGAITTTSTVDGRDVSVDGTKLDGVEALADVTDTANVTAAGALMDSELTSIASVKALNQGVATATAIAAYKHWRNHSLVLVMIYRFIMMVVIVTSKKQELAT